MCTVPYSQLWNPKQSLKTRIFKNFSSNKTWTEIKVWSELIWSYLTSLSSSLHVNTLTFHCRKMAFECLSRRCCPRSSWGCHIIYNKCPVLSEFWKKSWIPNLAGLKELEMNQRQAYCCEALLNTGSRISFGGSITPFCRRWNKSLLCGSISGSKMYVFNIDRASLPK